MMGKDVIYEFMDALGYADDGTILALTVSSIRSMLRMCQEFGEEYGVIITGRKLYVCVSVADAILTLPR